MTTTRRLLLGAALSLPAAPALAKDSLGARIAARAAKERFSGAVAVRHGGKRLYGGAFGLADLAFAVPVRADTRFRIASITKLFTATLILQLADEGLLDLKGPVSAALPGWGRGGAGAIPVACLLNHTSGLPNPDTATSYEQARDEGLPLLQTPLTTARLIDRYASGPPIAQPGKAFAYNNADYFVLGGIVERLAGQTLEAALTGRILTPLGLKDTGMAARERLVPRLATTTFRPDPKGPLVAELPIYWENFQGAGAMYSTVGDLAAFAAALFGGRLTSKASLEALLTPGLDDYGYGLWIRGLKAGGRRYRTAERYGSIMGANGVLFQVLEADLTVVLLANTNDADLGEFAADIARWALG